MAIPAFNADGVLPAFDLSHPSSGDRSPYESSIDEFVQRFATSPERIALLSNLVSFRQLISSDGYDRGLQFIDGSFVEDKENHRHCPPKDIDLMSLLYVPSKYPDRDTFNANGFAFFRDEIQNRPKNMMRFGLDAYSFLMPTVTYRTFTYWHGLFSLQRDSNAWKGYVVIPLNPALDVQARNIISSL